MNKQQDQRILVCGGRYFNDWSLVQLMLTKLHQLQPIATIIHGAANGADSLASKWAHLNAIPEQPYPAKWHLYGKAAGPIRNRQMLIQGQPTLVVAFSGGIGTANMVTQARAFQLNVLEISNPDQIDALFPEPNPSQNSQ